MAELNPNQEPEKLELSSLNVADRKRQELYELFPEVRTEGGKIDFDRLRTVLGDSVDAGRERYGMNWPGKTECIRTIQAPSVGTLHPCKEQSLDWDATGNVVIEGDNLEVLKELQKSYLGKIKMIYIDPPYNTGNDFIYPDNYSESLQTYLEYTGQVDSEGKKFGTNAESDGRFHSKWINMMFPRLFLAKNLLRQDGVVFISIDDRELVNLVRIADEAFGEENRLGVITVVSNMKGRSDDKFFATAHNYLVAYGRGDFTSLGVELPEEYWDDYPEIHEDGRRYRLQGLRKRGTGARRVDRPNMYYPIYINPVDRTVSLTRTAGHSEEVLPRLSDGEDGRWRWGSDTAILRLEELTGGVVGPEKRWDVFQVDFAENDQGAKRVKPKTVWIGPEFSNEAGNLEVKKLLGKSIFDTCKPTGLLQYCLQQATKDDDIVLDFFAGSGSTGQAVIEQNAQDGHRRTFICVQLPEATRTLKADGTWSETAASRAGYETISQITIARLSAFAKKFRQEIAKEFDFNGRHGTLDLGFRVFRLTDSNFQVWDGSSSKNAEQLGEQLSMHINHTLTQRTSEQILFEILLKSWGEPSLSLQVEEIDVAGVRVFSIAERQFLVCLESEVSMDFFRAVAALQPGRFVMLESAFEGNDQLKANAVQTFKTKGVTSFKVV